MAQGTRPVRRSRRSTAVDSTAALGSWRIGWRTGAVVLTVMVVGASSACSSSSGAGRAAPAAPTTGAVASRVSGSGAPSDYFHADFTVTTNKSHFGQDP